MSETSGPKKGDKVGFRVGKSKTYFEAKVDKVDGAFLVTVDADGKSRKVRPGACTVL